MPLGRVWVYPVFAFPVPIERNPQIYPPHNLSIIRFTHTQKDRTQIRSNICDLDHRTYHQEIIRNNRINFDKLQIEEEEEERKKEFPKLDREASLRPRNFLHGQPSRPAARAA